MTSSAADPGNRPFVRLVLLVVAVVVLAPVLTMGLAMPMVGMMGWGWHDGMAGFGPGWGFGFSFLWLVVLVVLGYLGYRAVVGGLEPSGGSDPALEELRLAYARGDLTDEEFEDRRAVLAGDDDAGP